MALTHREKTVSSLKINKVPSKAVYQKMIDQGLINNDELYLVQEADTSIINKFTFTATKGQQTFIIPFEFADSKALTVYYNGVMMKEPENYTISGKVITLVNWTAEAGDYLTVMGIEGAVAIDVDARVQEIQGAVDDGKVSIQNAVNQATTTVENLKKQIDELKKQIPDDVTKAVYKNTIIALSSAKCCFYINFVAFRLNNSIIFALQIYENNLNLLKIFRAINFRRCIFENAGFQIHLHI